MEIKIYIVVSIFWAEETVVGCFSTLDKAKKFIEGELPGNWVGAFKYRVEYDGSSHVFSYKIIIKDLM